MKRYTIIFSSICLACILASGYFTYNRYTSRVNDKKDLLVSYADNVHSRLSIILSNIQELPYIVKPIVVEKDLFNGEVDMSDDNLRHLERVYEMNRFFIKGISIYDRYGNVFNVSQDKDSTFIHDRYKSRNINVLRSTNGVVVEKKYYYFILPVFHGDTLAGNISVNMDVQSLQDSIFRYYMDIPDVWPTSIVSSNIFTTFPVEDELTLTSVDKISETYIENRTGFVYGKITGKDFSTKVLSYYESIPMSENIFGWIFSYNISPVIGSSITEFLIISIGVLILTIFALITLRKIYYNTIIQTGKRDRIIDTMKKMFEELPAGIVIYKQNRLYEINQCALKILNDYISPNDIGHEIQSVMFPAGYNSESSQEYPNDWTLFSVSRNGRDLKYCKKQISVDLYGDKYLIDALWDITKLDQSRVDALRSEIAKSELLSRISTDFKRPLDDIKDAVVLLDGNYPDDPKIRLIRGAAKSMSSMIDDMQDFADIESGRVVLDEMPFNIITEVKKITDKYMAKAKKKGIPIHAFIAHSTIRDVVGDAQRFGQVLDQLLSNAVKFTQEGEIRITIETAQSAGGKALITCSVEDTGRGMTKKQLKTLFSLDLRAKEEGESIGLGVIVSNKLVKMMGGTIRVTSPSPISVREETPGVQFIFTIQCSINPQSEKKLDFSAITSFNQLGLLVIASEINQEQHLDQYLHRKGIKHDTFVYNKDSADLLINRLIIDKGRYHIIIIDTNDSGQGFAIAGMIHQGGFTDNSLFVMIDADRQKGNYLKSRKLGMDYYFRRDEYLPGFEDMLEENFRNISTRSDPDKLQKDLTILVAEDNVLSRTVAQLAFKSLGYNIDFAMNALELVSLMNKKSYDVIFIDSRFPPSDGLEIARMLRQKGYKMPIIAMTSTMTKENLKNISDSGMNGYLSKPLSLKSVKEILLKWFV